MKPKKENAIKILFQFVGEEKGKMTLSVILAIIGEIFGMLPFLAAAMLANEVYAKTASFSKAIFWSGLAILGVVFRTVLCATSSKRSHRIAFTILKNIRRAIADKMKRVPMGVMLETPSGAFKTLMVDNVGKLEDSVAHMIPEAPSQIAAPFCCILLIFILDWRMGLVSLVTIPLGIPFIMGMMRGYSEKMELYLRSGKEMNASLVEYVGGIQVIKAFGRSGESYGKFSDSVHFFHDSTLAWWKQCWFWMAAVRAIIPSTMLGTLPAGAWLYMNGEISLPVYLSSIIIPLGFIAPLMKLAFGSEQLTTIMANLQPIREFLAIKEQSRPSKKAALKDTSYSFENVSFSYNDSKEVLHNISFSTAPGTMTAIVGPSGSGKSTIAKLMAGFWDADSGVVKYSSENIKNIPFEQLMGEISYVAQDNFLFDMSIRENIRMGNPLASNEEIEQAAQAANCHEFILKLEHGYDTLAGDAGDRLSGGERQRIAIARAMLKKSNVVILDEATAYADPESEALIQEAVGRLVRGKTLIVVAHRLSTIQNADQILVVDHGAIIARGTQKELLDTCTLYKTMWEQHIGTIEYTDKGGEAACLL
ncbi:ABC transporter ATP-binding protein [Lacrimispora sp. 38-1]|uniref:ABC transporter ATP-binding protein n=1 Tax=Lacrimispora sp. 38-1 TaxID=3125778 RepID=UPI003CE89F86